LGTPEFDFAQAVISLEERDIEKNCGLERDAEPNVEISSFHFRHRHASDSDPLCQRVKCPAPFKTRGPDLRAEELRSLLGNR
jgi:hypothetical protein